MGVLLISAMLTLKMLSTALKSLHLCRTTFPLDPVYADLVGRPNLSDGSPSYRGQLLVPCLKVLPMGWGWSLALCQNVLEAAIEEAGFTRDQLIQDKVPGRIVSSESTAVAAYVDNFGVFSTDPEVSKKGVDSITRVLVSKVIYKK